MMELSHDELARSLADHLRTESCMTWCDVQLGPSGSPRPDVYTIRKSYLHPMPLAYECKVSTSDFRGDVTSGKWQSYLRYAAGVYFASGVELLSKELVPDHCGLMLRNADGVWRTAKRPVLRPCTIPQEALLKLLIDGVQREGPLYRARVWKDSVISARVSKQFGKTLARVVRDRLSVEQEIDSAKRHVKRMEDDIAARVVAAQKEANTVLSPLRTELCEILQLAPTAGCYEIRNKVADLRRAAAEHPAVSQLNVVRAALQRVISQCGGA